MSEKRQDIRYRTIAHVRARGLFEGDALLKDISVTGCRIETTVFINARPGIVYTLKIIPESISKIAPFDLQVENRWVNTESDSCEAGFLVKSSPGGKQFQRYVDYLAWRPSNT
ncbi:MAG: PilZ domain-containing protein [Treponema sp.]|jgi:hypothetical protein|nr:PilZ domain-containing protein [Treponema sp.]